MLVQDQTLAQQKRMPLTEPCVFEKERFFLDGPVSERLAVLDFGPETGALALLPTGTGTYSVSVRRIAT